MDPANSPAAFTTFSGSSDSADPGVGRVPRAGGEPRGVERVGGRGFGVEDPTAVRGGRQRRRHGKLAAGAVEARSYGSEVSFSAEAYNDHLNSTMAYHVCILHYASHAKPQTDTELHAWSPTPHMLVCRMHSTTIY